MAEAAALIGLVASIASLIDLSAKVVSRLTEFTSKASDVPKSFRSLSIQLPLLTTTLQHIQTQAQAGHLTEDATRAVKAAVDSTSDDASLVQTYLSHIIPVDGASRLERALKALKSLAKEDKIQMILERIHSNIDVLQLHQSGCILEKLSKLNVELPASKSFGLCLGQAPQIGPDAFIGRTAELQQLQSWLSPIRHPDRQSIVSIVGMGGMGKTQLSQAHVRDRAKDYSSVFWLDARDETSLRHSMADISAIVFPDSSTPTVQSADSEKLKIDRVRRWLSEPGNDQWLLIFDNYDDPLLPGVRSLTGYDIRSFFPIRSQGSIIITSRSTKLTFTTQLKLRKLEDVDTSVAILSQRSGRDMSQDSSALTLANRLAGLPLALATTGTFLGRGDISCSEYLELYNSAWIDLFGPGTEELLEYDTRTMSSTWTISLNQVRHQDEDAAELLTFLAYLGARDIRYELIKAGANDGVPWTRRVTKDKIHFQRAMSKLHDYSLVDIVEGSYQVHPCLHDWLVESLNTPPKPLLFITALRCIDNSLEHYLSPQFGTASRRLFEHIEQLESPLFNQLWQLCASERTVFFAASNIAGMLHNYGWHEKAEKMYTRALVGKEKVLGPDHTSTLESYINLGLLYCVHCKFITAEQIFLQALAVSEKTLRPDHTLNLSIIGGLASSYSGQEKLVEAEEMYIRVIAAFEKAVERDNSSIVDTIDNLGNEYNYKDKSFTSGDHLFMFTNYGDLLFHTGRLAEAEGMYQRALTGTTNAFGSEHSHTLIALASLGQLRRKQGELVEGERMYRRALAGLEKVRGQDNQSVLFIINEFGILLAQSGKHAEARQMYHRAQDGYQRLLGAEHPNTVTVTKNLARLERQELEAGKH